MTHVTVLSTVVIKGIDMNQPEHYSEKELEPIEVIESWDCNFNLGNVIKYIGRHEDKNGLEDLEKAKWYLERYIDNYKDN